MRILHVIQELDVGGAERVVLSLVRGAREAGHEVAVAAAHGALAGELDLRRHDLPLVRRRSWILPAAAARLRRALAAERPHVLHCHNPTMAVVAALATARRARGLVSIHGVPDGDYRAAARLLRWSGLPVVACGTGIAAGLEDHGCKLRATVPNGIAPAPEPADRERLARDWSLPRGNALVLAVGRLAPVKNHKLAIEALRELPRATLVLVGEGELREALGRDAESAGVRERVVFAGVRTDARALIGAADVVVHPSKSEGLPLTALETLAAGVPLVATSVRGLRDLLVDGKNALLVPPDDPVALAEALRRVLTDGELAQALASAGRQLAASFTDETMVRAYLQLYDEVRQR